MPSTPAIPRTPPAKRRRPGRPRSLDTARRKLLLKLLSQGNFRKHALLMIGVGSDALRRAMRDEPEFKAAVQSAELTATRNAVACFTRAAMRDWKAAVEFLRRKCPEWGIKDTAAPLKISVGTGGREDELLAKLLAPGVQHEAPQSAVPSRGGSSETAGDS